MPGSNRRFFTFTLIAGLVGGLLFGCQSAETDPDDPDYSGDGASIVDADLSGTWRINREATARRFLLLKGIDFDTLPPEQKERSMEIFQFPMHLRFERNGRWSGEFQAGQKTKRGSGNYRILEKGTAGWKVELSERTAGVRNLLLRFKSMEEFVLIFLEDEEKVQLVLFRESD